MGIANVDSLSLTDFPTNVLHAYPFPGDLAISGRKEFCLASIKMVSDRRQPLLPLLVTNHGHLVDLISIIAPKLEVIVPGF